MSLATFFDWWSASTQQQTKKWDKKLFAQKHSLSQQLTFSMSSRSLPFSSCGLMEGKIKQLLKAICLLLNATMFYYYSYICPRLIDKMNDWQNTRSFWTEKVEQLFRLLRLTLFDIVLGWLIYCFSYHLFYFSWNLYIYIYLHLPCFFVTKKHYLYLLKTRV